MWIVRYVDPTGLGPRELAAEQAVARRRLVNLDHCTRLLLLEEQEESERGARAMWLMVARLVDGTQEVLFRLPQHSPEGTEDVRARWLHEAVLDTLEEGSSAPRILDLNHVPLERGLH
jgi:hypothetical protein